MASKKQVIQQQTSPSHQPRFKKVILLDDSDVDLFINETILKAVAIAGEMKCEHKPSSVLDQLKKTERLSDLPELIFLDLHMDEMNGFEFLNEFNKLPDFVKSKCKIVVVTSSHDKDHRFRALMNTNVIRYLVKPLDIFQLKDLISSDSRETL